MSSIGTNASTFLKAGCSWLGDLVTVNNICSIVAIGGPVVSGASNDGACVYLGGYWSGLSQTGAAGLSKNTFSGSKFDAIQYYNPNSADFELAFTGAGINAPYTYRQGASGTQQTFSTLTGAPAAQFIASFDDRLVFASVTSFAGASGNFPQRVQWSARGDPQTYTVPDGGAEDLESARGNITRLIAVEDRLLVFFANEIWQGLRAPFPFGFQFIQLHPNIGTRQPWSVTKTPYGVVFLGGDQNIYLIPPGGTPIVIGSEVWRLIRNTQYSATNNVSDFAVSGVYSESFGAYIMAYPNSSNGLSQAVMLHLDPSQRGQVDPMGFDVPSGWSIMRLGSTSLASNQVNTGVGPQRVIAADSGTTGNLNSNILDFTSNATNDLGTAIDCRRLFTLPNPDPTQRLFVREVRLDYRAASSSSLSVRMTPDFGSSYPVDMGVALPTASTSAQTIVSASIPAIYPGIELRHASGQTFSVQGLTAIVESLGNG